MRIKNAIWKSKNAYLFILPLFTGLIIFSYDPAFSSIYHSFFEWDILGNKEFIGFENFKNLLKDPIFLNSIPAMLKLMVPKILISVVVPLIFAEMIVSVKSEKLQSIYRVIVLLPMVAPAVVGTLLWKDIYDPSQGLAVALCRLFVNRNILCVANCGVIRSVLSGAHPSDAPFFKKAVNTDKHASLV